jgi:type II secretion system protein J
MNSRSGFSLLELLVALALLAIIGAGLAGAMRLGTETFTRAQALETDKGHVAARAQLRRLIERATSPALLTPFPKAFRGSENSLSFVTLAPLGFARDSAGLRITVALSGNALVATIEPFDDDGTVLRSYTSPLADGVTDIQMRYFDDGEWVSEWTDTLRLPQLAQIVLNDGTDPYWPEFTVELVYAN